MEQKSPLEGQVCLVTGASRGIGAAIAGDLARLGARLVVHFGTSKAKAKNVAAQLEGSGHGILQGDLADPSIAERLIGAVVRDYGRLDVLVNNAGIFTPHPPLQVNAADWLASWEEIIAVNLLAPATLSHAAAHVMSEQGGGRIINVGSRGAFRGEPNCPAYGAAKAGLHAMSQSLAIALAPAGITVYAVAPGFVATEMADSVMQGDAGDSIRAQSPLNRVARPEEVAETVAFLASAEGEFLTGSIIDINGASYLRT